MNEKNVGQNADSNSDDESLNDNTSVYSMRSDANGSIDDESDDVGVASTEKYEEKLVQAIENATEKSVQIRVAALQAICEIMMHRFLPDFIEDRKITIMDLIEKSIRRGKGTEQALAAQLAPLLIMQLGGGEEIIKNIGQLLLVTAQNKSSSFDARVKCVSALALLNFFGGDDIGDVITLMQHFEGIFSGSYLKGDKTPAAVAAEAGSLHAAALSAWGLLLTLIPPGDFCSLMTNNSMTPSIRNLIGMLQSPHLEVRMVTGEVIALVLECGRAHDEDFLASYLPELIDATKLLATDSNKFRAKRDRKTQRATFRDVLRYLEDDTPPEITIRFGSESLELDTWAIHHQYTALCAIMGPGMTSHLRENDFLRDVLQLGSKLIQSNGMAVFKQKKLERRLINAAAFKARTLSRSKNRDKRSAVFA
ncbi:Interferon-related developmental regulator 1 [Pseudolycoriella hygida]|uniref:Interferon-related developmental regulator 1 n=1 Tax=Pseudolycoriella hygida TaxID=35572 RepID=A0A9Q0RUK7_9DIPT|nr:Interferon-related developmental regulator 1 [Pseudolycoriella hygida]